jgi:hypothetical protein
LRLLLLLLLLRRLRLLRLLRLPRRWHHGRRLRREGQPLLQCPAAEIPAVEMRRPKRQVFHVRAGEQRRRLPPLLLLPCLQRVALLNAPKPAAAAAAAAAATGLWPVPVLWVGEAPLACESADVRPQ